MKSFFVYIIRSEANPDKHYTGFTENLLDRLAHHNSGAVPATRPYRPWILKSYMAFDNESKAREFEKYLKSHSGRAFAKKHF